MWLGRLDGVGNRWIPGPAASTSPHPSHSVGGSRGEGGRAVNRAVSQSQNVVTIKWLRDEDVFSVGDLAHALRNERGRSEGFPVQLLPSMRRINMRVQPNQQAMGRWLGAPRL